MKASFTEIRRRALTTFRRRTKLPRAIGMDPVHHILALLVTFTAVSWGVFHTYCHVERVHYGYRLSALTREIRNLQKEEEMLRLAVARSRAHNRVREIAEMRLNMTDATPGQIVRPVSRMASK